MNSLLFVRRSDLITESKNLPLEEIEWNFLKIECYIKHTDNVLFIDGDKYKVLKCRLGNYKEGYVGSIEHIEDFIKPTCIITPEIRIIKALSALSKKYNVCILTATQTIIPTVNCDVIVLDRANADSVYVEVVKPREGGGPSQPLFQVSNIWKK
jgi:hypothetical protein